MHPLHYSVERQLTGDRTLLTILYLRRTLTGSVYNILSLAMESLEITSANLLILIRNIRQGGNLKIFKFFKKKDSSTIDRDIIDKTISQERIPHERIFHIFENILEIVKKIYIT